MGTSVKGGDKMAPALDKVVRKLSSAKQVRVGFLEDKTYPDGTPIASIAVINEFGGTAKVPDHTQTVYREVNKAGTAFNKNGRFVKKSASNFTSDHEVKAYTITIPARPFFRKAVKEGTPHWGADLGKILVSTGYDTNRALGQMGEEIKGEIQDSIRDFVDPPNAASTIRKKGADKPLIDTGLMLKSVDFQTTE
jgi:hypothetical protein